MFPVICRIGPVTLYSFGLLVVLGFAAGILLASRLARARGLPGEFFLDGAAVILAASIVGARLVFVALNWGEYSQRLLDLGATWQGGMSVHGGVIAGAAAGLLYMRRRGAPPLAMADAAAPGIALGYAIGRIGCLLNGCCYGGPTGAPWGLPFPGGAPGVHYHPAQVYAAVAGLLLTGWLIWAYRRPHRVGQVLALFAGGYSLYRLAIEVVRRGVTAETVAYGLTQAQVFSLFALAASAAWWLWLQRRSAPAPAAPSGQPGSPAPSSA